MKRYMKTLCLGLMLMFSASAMAQNQTVTGTVLDEAGEPVIGATVTVTGTKTATITDFDGNYKIDVPKGGKVTITYIGYLSKTVTWWYCQSGRRQADIGRSRCRRLWYPEEGSPDRFYRYGRHERRTRPCQRWTCQLSERFGKRSVCYWW